MKTNIQRKKFTSIIATKSNKVAILILISKVTLINKLKLNKKLLSILIKNFNKFSHLRQKIKLNLKRKRSSFKSSSKRHLILLLINPMHKHCSNFSKKEILNNTKGKKSYFSYQNNYISSLKQFNT